MPKKTTSADLPDAQWFASSYGGGDEVAFIGTSIAVRDTRKPDDGVQVYDMGEWKAFMESVKTGEVGIA